MKIQNENLVNIIYKKLIVLKKNVNAFWHSYSIPIYVFLLCVFILLYYLSYIYNLKTELFLQKRLLLCSCLLFSARCISRTEFLHNFIS